jgi:hypothetical protein
MKGDIERDLRAESNSKIVPLRPGVVHQPSPPPRTKKVTDQQRVIRGLSARYRSSRSIGEESDD